MQVTKYNIAIDDEDEGLHYFREDGKNILEYDFDTALATKEKVLQKYPNRRYSIYFVRTTDRKIVWQFLVNRR